MTRFKGILQMILTLSLVFCDVPGMMVSFSGKGLDMPKALSVNSGN